MVKKDAIIIEKIKAVKECDTDADLSWLDTEYEVIEDDNGKMTDLIIIKSCRYTQDEINDKNMEEYLNYIKQDLHRLETYGSQWCMVGVRVIAEIRINGVWQQIHSAGLWGIESDSDYDYFKQVALEEVAELKSMLLEIGLPEDYIDGYIKEMEMF